MSTDHELELRPQSIADGWEARCKCGWRKFRSFMTIANRDEMIKTLREDYAKHAR
jgi:hypothetical protein